MNLLSALSSQRAVSVVCEWEMVTKNERAYCTGVQVCVNYRVTSVVLCEETFRLKTLQNK